MENIKNKMNKVLDKANGGDKDKEGVAGWLESMFGGITRASAAQQTAVGGVSGFCAGYAAMKVGKAAAITIGGSLLLFQLACHQGYISVDWNKLNSEWKRAKKEIEKATKRQSRNAVKDVKEFARENVVLASAFAGGFLIGISAS